MLVPMNVCEGILTRLMALLGCKKRSFPFTYLGMPLSANMLKFEDFIPICQKVERRLVGCSTMISYD